MSDPVEPDRMDHPSTAPMLLATETPACKRTPFIDAGVVRQRTWGVVA